MPATRVARLTSEDHKRLQRLAEETGQSHVEVLHHALDMFEREHFLNSLREAFDRLRDDQEAWKVELDERAAWDRTSGDTALDG